MPALPVLEVVCGDEHHFHVPMQHGAGRCVPFFVLWLVNQGWCDKIELEGPEEAAELAVETAMDANFASVKRLLEDCGLMPSHLIGTWMDKLQPNLQEELYEKFYDFLDPEVLRRCCVRPATTNVEVKVTFVLDEDNWGWA
jgi:hypothetical protein